MTHARFALSSAALLALLTLRSTPARADDTDEAREAFKQGAAQVEQQQWGAALGWLERAQHFKPHALTLYNIGIVEQHLGHLTRARANFAAALSLDLENNHTQLAPSLVDETNGFIRDLDMRLVYVQVTMGTPGATLTIDGRPLAADPSGRTKLYYAGIAAATDAPPALPPQIEVAVDPGERDFLVQKSGFTPKAVKVSELAGKRTELALSLAPEEATIRVDSDRKDAVVRVAGLDLGTVPISVKRPAGSYVVDVRSAGYVTYQTTVDVAPGGKADLYAQLPKEEFAISKQWWFWTGLGVVVAGVATTVYFATRPPAPYDGGSTGWVAQPR
jgi:hypothetical protein